MTQVLRTPRPAVAYAARTFASARAALAADPLASPATQVLNWGLAVVAGLLLWVVLFGLVLSSLSYSHAQHGLYSDFREQLALGVAPTGGAIHEGAPVALLNSSVADLHGVVAVEGSSSRDLRNAPGHTPGTPLPGQPGASLLLGRSTSFGAPFADITHLHRGDVIDVTTGQGQFHYEVADVRGPGDPLPKQLAAGGSQLTLVTAQGGGWRSGWAPTHAVYVDALLQGDAVAAPGGAGTRSDADAVLAHDDRGLYPLVLWLQLLLVAGIGGIVLRSRLGTSRAWLLAVPIGLAALWGASQNAWLLLPNLL